MLEFNGISIPYYFLIPCLVAFLLNIFILLKVKFVRDGKRQWSWISIVVMLGMYSLILAIVIYNHVTFNLQLEKFDLNQDGFFTPDEITPQQQEAMKKVVNDTARTFSMFTGLIFSAVIAFLVFILGKAFDFITNKV